MVKKDDIEIDEPCECLFHSDPGHREPLVLQVLTGVRPDEIAEVMGIRRGKFSSA